MKKLIILFLYINIIGVRDLESSMSSKSYFDDDHLESSISTQPHYNDQDLESSISTQPHYYDDQDLESSISTQLHYDDDQDLENSTPDQSFEDMPQVSDFINTIPKDNIYYVTSGYSQFLFFPFFHNNAKLNIVDDYSKVPEGYFEGFKSKNVFFNGYYTSKVENLFDRAYEIHITLFCFYAIFYSLKLFFMFKLNSDFSDDNLCFFLLGACFTDLAKLMHETRSYNFEKTMNQVLFYSSYALFSYGNFLFSTHINRFFDFYPVYSVSIWYILILLEARIFGKR